MDENLTTVPAAIIKTADGWVAKEVIEVMHGRMVPVKEKEDMK